MQLILQVGEELTVSVTSDGSNIEGTLQCNWIQDENGYTGEYILRFSVDTQKAISDWQPENNKLYPSVKSCSTIVRPKNL
jgi:hypothetical protein